MMVTFPGRMSLTFDHLFRNFAVYKMQKLICKCQPLQHLVYRWFVPGSTPEGIRYYIYGNIHVADIVILYFNGSAFLPTQPRREFINYQFLLSNIEAKVAIVSIETGKLGFPQTMEMYQDVYEWLQCHYDIPANKTIFMGVSSGGMIAMSLIVHLLNLDHSLPLGLVLVSPCVNGYPNIQENPDDPQRVSREFFSRTLMRNIDSYRRSAVNNSLLSPMYHNFKTWVPTILFHVSGDQIVEPGIDRVLQALNQRPDSRVIIRHNVIHAYMAITWYRQVCRTDWATLGSWIDKLHSNVMHSFSSDSYKLPH